MHIEFYCSFTHMSNDRSKKMREYLRKENYDIQVVPSSEFIKEYNQHFYGKMLRISMNDSLFNEIFYSKFCIDFPEVKLIFISVGKLIFTPTSFFKYINTDQIIPVKYLSVSLNVLRISTFLIKNNIISCYLNNKYKRFFSNRSLYIC